jgi:hypothetical protein
MGEHGIKKSLLRFPGGGSGIIACTHTAIYNSIMRLQMPLAAFTAIVDDHVCMIPPKLCKEFTTLSEH